MMSLFTPFDMVFYFKGYLIFCVLISYFFSPLFLSSSYMSSSFKLWGGLSSFFFSLKPKMFSKGMSLSFYSLFIFLLMMNFFSVWSYNFPGTSQVSNVLIFSLTGWLMLIIFQMKNSFKFFISHLIPEGTPLPLTWFLFLIELVSSLIRPITLTVRLVANILAGHLLMILLFSLVKIFSLGILAYFVLNTVELFVALIQSYIFCTMICLYFSESH